jgi:hypothetical protein
MAFALALGMAFALALGMAFALALVMELGSGSTDDVFGPSVCAS